MSVFRIFGLLDVVGKTHACTFFAECWLSRQARSFVLPWGFFVMTIHASKVSLFESIDLVDLWRIYEDIERAASFRNISASKISRRWRDLLDVFGLFFPSRGCGFDDDILQHSVAYCSLSQAFQQWRFECGRPKVLPTFTTSSAFRLQGHGLDVLPHHYFSSDQLRRHLLTRRVDLIVSSSLDLAGELIVSALVDEHSPFVALPLMREPVFLALNVDHPLVGLPEVSAQDCDAFPSPAYPDGVATLAATALKARGAWKHAGSSRSAPRIHDWVHAMQSRVGLSYMSSLLQVGIPGSDELRVIPFAEPLEQTTFILLLKEVAAWPSSCSFIAACRELVLTALALATYEVNLIT